MILVDTNIFVDLWKKPEEQVIDLFKKEDIAICGVVEAELLHGARSTGDMNAIANAISCFANLPYSNDWQKLGKMLYKLRTSGLTVPLADVIIAQVSIEHGVPLFSKDKHFGLIQQVLSELKLYKI